MDEGWRKDVDELKARTTNAKVADFIEELAIWGVNNQDHSLLWEAMVSVVEADEKGDFIGLLGDDEE